MSSLCNYLLFIEYDGARFSGLAKTAWCEDGAGEIEKALSKLGFRGATTVAAGRTDKGMHACGQAISVKFKKKTGDDIDLRHCLNRRFLKIYR